MASSPRSFLVMLDVSGSMVGDRIATAKAAIVQTLEQIAAEIAYEGLVIDVGISTFDTTLQNITRNEASFQDIADLIDWVNAIELRGNTSFITAGQGITDYFTATVGKTLKRRSYLFLSDGEPTVGTAADGAAAMADVLDQNSGIFNLTDGTEVNGYGAGVGSASNLAAIAQMYNATCPNTPVVNDIGEADLKALLDGVAFSDSPEDLAVADQTTAWLLPTNWSRGHNEEIAFRTEILTSADATEQRIAQRDAPRIKMKMTSFLNHIGMRQATVRLSENQARFMYMPSPRRSTFLVSEAAFGQSVLFVDEKQNWMTPGRRMILDFGDAREMVTLVDSCDTRLVVGGTLQHTFGPGTRVYRAAPGNFTRQTTLTARTSRAGEIPIEFDCDAIFNYREPVEAAKTLYRGKELFVHAVNWRRPLNARFEQPVVNVDLQRGPRDRITPIDFTTRRTRVLGMITGEETFQETYGFFARHKGRWKTFYAPMHLNEILPIGGVLTGETQMTISGREYFDVFDGSAQYGDLLIQSEGAAPLFLEVSDITLDVLENTVLTFATPFAADIALTTIQRISWLALHRFSNDTMTINWRTSTTGEVAMTMQTVRE